MRILLRTLGRIYLAFLAAFAFVLSTSAQTLTDSASIVSLATNVTEDFTFTDASGLSVVVAVTMTPYSASNASPSFTLLDNYGSGFVHLGIESGTGGGDGNWVQSFEGANFSATLASASPGVITNSVKFSIADIGLRPDGAEFTWSSSVTTNSFSLGSESLAPLDSSMENLAGAIYVGQLRSGPDGGLYQMSDFVTNSGHGIVFNATFLDGTGAPLITQNPSDQSICLGSGAVLAAFAVGDPAPAVQWQVMTGGGGAFENIFSATNSELSFTPALADSGNQYRAVFTNFNGAMTSSVATLTVTAPLGTPTIQVESTSVFPNSTNTASTQMSASSYAWSISNGRILGATNGPEVTYVAGPFGDVTLTLTVANGACSATVSTTVSGVAGGVYSSDQNSFIEVFGGNGAGAQYANVSNPFGIAFDRAGNLYVADQDDNQILEIATNSSVSVYANVTSPYALAFDGAGNLFVSDYTEDSIWEVATNGGLTALFCGTNIYEPMGLAFDRSGNLYVANYGAGDVVEFSTNGVSSIYAYDTANASGLAFDAVGNLYVSDDDDNMLWKVDAAGNMTPINDPSFTNPAGLAFDSAGNLYVANLGYGVISELSALGGMTSLSDTNLTAEADVAVWPPAPQLIPSGVIAFPPLTNTPGSEQIYVGSANGVVEEYGTNAFGTVWAGGLSVVQGLAFDRAGNLFVVDQRNSRVMKYDPLGSGSVLATNFNEPIAITVDDAGNVYVSDTNGVEKVSPGGVVSNFWPGHSTYSGLTRDASGNIYLADSNGGAIYKIDALGKASEFITGDVKGPSGLAFDSAGNLYVANALESSIEKYSSAGADLGNFAYTDPQPCGLAFDKTGTLYVTCGVGSINTVDTNGNASEFAFYGGSPTYVAIRPATNGNAVLPATLSNARISNHQFQFDLAGTPGADYVIEVKANPSGGPWVSVYTNAAPFTFTETNTATNRNRFYRAMAAP